MDVAGHLPHDDYFLGGDIGHDNAVATDSDTAVCEVDGTFDAAVNIERFGAAHFALDDNGTTDGGLLHGCRYVFGWCVSVWARGIFWWVRGILCWLQHRCRPSLFRAAYPGSTYSGAQPRACEMVAKGQFD